MEIFKAEWNSTPLYVLFACLEQKLNFENIKKLLEKSLENY